MRRWKSWRPYKTSKKYSSENYSFYAELSTENTSVPAESKFVTLVDTTASQVLGTRKVKNFTLKLSLSKMHDVSQDANRGLNAVYDIGYAIPFALVYVPEGNDPNSLSFNQVPNSISMYEPNQNVILCGEIISGETKVFTTRLARNLNYGDKIMLVYCPNKIPKYIKNNNYYPLYVLLNGILSFNICFN